MASDVNSDGNQWQRQRKSMAIDCSRQQWAAERNGQVLHAKPPNSYRNPKVPVCTTTLAAYSTFVFSIVTYVAQLEKPSTEILKQGFKKVIKGPLSWIEPEDLWRLKDHYCQSNSCKSLHHTSLAAQLRVRKWYPSCQHPPATSIECEGPARSS